jgi:hypothetical protein
MKNVERAGQGSLPEAIEIFARKIVRAFGSGTEDIKNETDAHISEDARY